MKTQKTTLIVLFSLFSQLLQAEDVIYFHPQSDQLSEFVVENPTTEAEEFWVLIYQNEFVEETHFEIPALSKKKVLVKDLKTPDQDFTVLIKNPLVQLPKEFQKDTSTLFEKSVLPDQKIQISPINLWVHTQTIQIEFLDHQRNILKTENFESASYMKSLNLEITTPKNCYKIRAKSPQKITFPPLNQMKAQVDHSRKPDSTEAVVAYFLVENGDRSSFIAPIKKPELIEKARQEITNFQGFMVFAEIDFNENDVNRNLLNPNKPYWNWKITEVTGLAQIGATWCQAYPEMIERMLFQLINQKQVCFKGQRIIRELKPEEL